MDGTTFDRLVRSLDVAASRRRVLVAVVAALVGGRFASAPAASFATPVRPDSPAAEADEPTCKASGKTCRKASECCSGSCGTKGKKKGRNVCKACSVSRCGAKDNACAGPVCGCNGDDTCGCWQRVGGGATCGSIAQGACVECDSDAVCARLFGVKGAQCIKTPGRNCSCPYGLTTGCVAPCGQACVVDGLACKTGADCCSGVCGCQGDACFCRHETCGPERAACNLGNYDLDCCEGKCKPDGDGPAGRCVTGRLG